MLNTVALMGRLTADPELKYTQSNIPVTRFCLAVERRYSGADGERQTDFINCVAWRQTAEFVAKWFRKGQLAAVDGSIQTRKYQDRDGNNRTAFEVVAANVHFTGSRRDTEGQEADRAAQGRSSTADGQRQKGAGGYTLVAEQGRRDDSRPEEDHWDDDDLPF